MPPLPRRDIAARAWLCAMLSLSASCSTERPSGVLDFDVAPVELPDVDSAEAGPRGPRPLAPYPAYDLSVTLPYRAAEQTFAMEALPQAAARLDVHLCIDTTGSFGGEISALQSSLHQTILPGLRQRVGDLYVGVSRFADFPVATFGVRSDHVYDLLTPLTNDFARVGYAVNTLSNPLQNGGDGPEAWGEALYQIATGVGLRVNNTQYIPAFTSRSASAGGVGFRDGSARVVVNVTDAPAHESADYDYALPGTHGTAAAATALRAVNAHLIGIASGAGARPQLESLAFATGATEPAVNGQCPTGINGASRGVSGPLCPLVFDILPDGTGLARTLLDAIVRYLDNLQFAVVAGAVSNDPNGFVTAVEAASAETPIGGDPPGREDRQPTGRLDGVVDTFTQVANRTRTRFVVHLQNNSVPTREQPQVFFVRVDIFGDLILLSSRVVRVIIPEGPKPDASRDVTPVNDASDQDVTDAD